MRYDVDFHVYGWYGVTVEADDKYDAIAKAEEIYCKANFGDLDVADCEIHVLDDDGNEV